MQKQLHSWGCARYELKTLSKTSCSIGTKQYSTPAILKSLSLSIEP